MERGNVLGHLAASRSPTRFARLHVSGQDGLAPTPAEVVRFLESEPRQH